MGVNVLITGGAGFIGSHLTRALLANGNGVRILDDFSSGTWGNLQPFARDIELIEGDIRDLSTCRAATGGVDVVFHLAAIASVTASVEDPIRSHRINVDGTLNMLVAARDAGVRKLVYSSSASVYGDADIMPIREEQPIRPLSPYASGKAMGEYYCHNFYELYQLETVALRYFNVFGPGQSTLSGYAAAIPSFIQALSKRRPPIVYGDGLQSRDFVSVENVIMANILAAEPQRGAGMALNVAAGHATSVLDLLAALGTIMGTTARPRFEPARASGIRHSCADVSLARQVLGYTPSVSLVDGLAATVEGFTRRRMHSEALPTVA